MEGTDGRSKGCGIVEFTNRRDAERAIRDLHDTDLHGRPMIVREDRDPEDRPPPSRQGDRERPTYGDRERSSHREPRGYERRSGGRREEGGGRRDRGREEREVWEIILTAHGLP